MVGRGVAYAPTQSALAQRIPRAGRRGRIYRWLGRRAKLEDGAKAAVLKSRATDCPLFPVLSLEGLPIKGPDGGVIAHAVGAMAECKSGRIAYLVIRRGGARLSEQLQAIGWDDVQAGKVFKTKNHTRAAG